MAEAVPAIKLTDTNNEEKEPARPFSPAGEAPPSPIFDNSNNNGTRSEEQQQQQQRPRTPTNANANVAKSKTKSPESAGSRISPGRLRRSLSNSAGLAAGESSAARGEEVNGKVEGAVQATGMDPLSQHILARTNTPFNASGTRPGSSDNAGSRSARGSIDQNATAGGLSSVERVDSFDSATAQKDLRKGVKAVAFISKLMGNKKKDDEGPAEDESVSNEGRPEGNDAEVFVQAVENIGFSPSHQQPPAYIKMRSKNKREKEFDRVFLAQELSCRKDSNSQRRNSSNKLRRKTSTPAADSNTVWTMEFSRNGKYLAAAGADGIVRVWKVISSLDDRRKHEQQESTESEINGSNPQAEHLNAPVFIRQPIREYEGHTSTVLDLSWSKNDFLLSSSMDKTVRLWHITRSECLCTFKHNDFVPSISFHPKDDRFFLAGSLDCKLRLWSIPDKRVAYAAQLQDMITAVAFTPDGKNAIAGCLGGACLFYETDGMKYISQTQVKSTRGQNAKGSKITGIQAYYDARGDVKLLITSNDSRIRLYNFRDKNLEIKFRGNENNYSQIRGAVSDDGRYLLCGSEDRKAYIWSVGPCEVEKRDKRPMEMFEAHNSITTVVCFAPTKTRILLGESEDPLYDLCNPPPVSLLSRDERTQSRAESPGSSRPASMAGSIQATPTDAKGEFKKPKESASYINRASHKNGNIIVTADFTGSIKVFRQDCAWSKRRLDDWDRSSLFSKRNGRLSRNGSGATRGGRPSLREGRTSMSTSGPSDRILNWRQGIASSPSVNEARASPKETPRSISPSKSEDQQSTDSPIVSTGPDWSNAGRTPPAAAKADLTSSTAQTRASIDGVNAPDSPRSKPVVDDNPLMLSGGRSYLFWDTDEWKAKVERQRKTTEKLEAERKLVTVPSRDDVEVDPNHLAVRPTLSRGKTDVSELSDERSSVSEYDDAREEHEKHMNCKTCGGQSFKARKSKLGGTKLVCTRCGERA